MTRTLSHTRITRALSYVYLLLLLIASSHAFFLSPTPILRSSLRLARSYGATAARRRNSAMMMGGDQDDKAAEGNDDLWASLRKRVGPTLDPLAAGSLPTADKQSASDVVTIVLRALMANDEPWENHGWEMLLSYHSPFAKESDPSHFATPESLKRKIEMNPDAEFLVDMQDFRLIDERTLNQATNYIIKASIQCSDMQWRATCFSLSRVESRWLIDDVGKAAL